MADDDLSIDDNDAMPVSEKKSGGIGSLLPVLLKWVAIIIGAIILIVTVVVITMNVMNKNVPAQAPLPTSPEMTGSRPKYDWYNSIGQIRTRTVDIPPASVVVEVVLGYKQQDKVTATEITERQIEIYDFLRQYFSSKTAAELKPQNEKALKLEICRVINDEILDSKIKEVRFKQLDVIEQ
ncbi:MAG: flagellar basal body-associated FliL family protein [Bacteroides sp.]|nr:flagellar basal body-associated FliL family protein [Prevotella sp.]MCM1407338.1 flagellar basal body-associated FliL family protein [Treponema brennaborense]MCM1469828.1 flagellar basal body-associated FliL family protein [Bacteroides sp.]